MELFGREMSKKEILEHIGDITHLGAIKSYIFNDGGSRGIRAVDFKTPGGIDFTVLLDRGMDISYLSYKSIPLHWRSLTKETSPNFYESNGDNWLRSFYGGLFVTCGLTYNGWACNDNGEELGMHGRFSNLCAENVWYDGDWVNDDYVMWVQGKVREIKFFEHKLLLTRKITTWMGKPKILVEDIVENIGADKSPLMILYHINFGFPLISENSKLIEGKSTVVGANKAAEEDINNFDTFKKPQESWIDQLFYHDIQEDKDGYSNIAIINEKFNNNNGIGLLIRYKKNTLPCLTQWKKMGKYGDYVCGLEPANNYVGSRIIEKEKGTLNYLKPGEKINFLLEFNILNSNKEIKEVKEKII